MKFHQVLFPLCAALSTFAMAKPGPGEGNDFHGRHVLILGIDGLRSDGLQAAKAPVLQGLARSGTSSMKAVAGGNLEDATKQPTISGPGWVTLLTGSYANKHGVVGNGTNACDQQPVPKGGSYQSKVAPHFAKWLKEAVPTASIASITSWPWIEDYLVAVQPQYFDVHTKGAGKDYLAADDDVSRQAAELLKTGHPDVMFLHYSQVDGAGHSTGFSTGNPAYLSAIEHVDGLVGQVVEAMKARPQIAKENWLVVVVTDHGGNGRSHGGQSEGERVIPMIVAGKGSSARGIVEETPGQHVVPATIFEFLGVPVKAEWGWEPGTFGLGKPATAAAPQAKPKS
ncbi:alkaline phosphatase family protein [Luteolibacter sp. LG18]|uniref:alkaline phosphatase family protein n=1 Tax=Luteolibacter sp. LG18 TaxID=2819286 RepID=UPI002B2C8C94|nr:nucleotide pyrophosphatase [Luteolibacter sp. LG18]